MDEKQEVQTPAPMPYEPEYKTTIVPLAQEADELNRHADEGWHAQNIDLVTNQYGQHSSRIIFVRNKAEQVRQSVEGNYPEDGITMFTEEQKNPPPPPQVEQSEATSTSGAAQQDASE